MASSSDEWAPGRAVPRSGGAPASRRHAAPEPVPDALPESDPAVVEPLPSGLSSPVRPYFFTRGRTRAAVELELETLLSVVPGAAWPSGPALAAFELCQEARSVAEVAALMGVPLGVARVLLGDLAEAGAVVVHRTATAEVPALTLMQRVLTGLRNL